MAKASTIFVCSECGYESAKWLGKCPGCNSWNSFYEEKIAKGTGTNKNEKVKANSAMPLNKVIGKEKSRVKTRLCRIRPCFRWWFSKPVL